MKIALVAHDNKKVLIEQLCIAYRRILSKHTLYATGSTGQVIEQNTSLDVNKYLSGNLGGEHQLVSQISNNEIDLVIFLRDSSNIRYYENPMNKILIACDFFRIPLATNIATAEALLLAMDRGDLNWRLVIN
jgi:methylglyoxal synthase